MKPIPFKNSYFELGRQFYQLIEPVPVRSPELIAFNEMLANELGLSDTLFSTEHGAAIFAGNLVPDGAAPLAMAYSGHQFGHFNPGLGDGRAILLGQVVSPSGQSLDIHMKGTGQTAFSRNGDGRAALGPVLREYLVSEAMARLGLPTTRALAAVTTGEDVIRERMLPGGIITRVGASFVRIGTFEHFLARRDPGALIRLADYVIERLYPELKESDNPYLSLLDTVIEGQAALIAGWMHIGFIHGVMNTDNMSIACETIDYGPCAFMDHYAHEQVYSSIDHHGRYAYNNQPNIALWNLSRFAECLLPLLAKDADGAVELATECLETFVSRYREHWLNGMRAKLGLRQHHEDDGDLIESLLAIMDDGGIDFTMSFYHLSQLDTDASLDNDIRAWFGNTAGFERWLDRWYERLRRESSENAERKKSMQKANPVYIPRNHQIEAAIRAAEDHGDLSAFHALHEVLQHPYEYQPGKETYMRPPRPHEVVHETFCGT